MDAYNLDVVVTRGGAVESRHRVHAAVVGPTDALIGGAGDPNVVSFWRSGSKPFLVMPFVAAGAIDDLAWGDDELALACASHGGEPEHVAIAASMLGDIGLEEGDLACGAHEPLSPRGIRLARETGTAIFTSPQQLLGKARGDAGACARGGVGHGWLRAARPSRTAERDDGRGRVGVCASKVRSSSGSMAVVYRSWRCRSSAWRVRTRGLVRRRRVARKSPAE